MGVMLIGGFLWVGAVIAQRVQNIKNKSEGTEIVTEVIGQADAPACKDITLPRPAGAKIEYRAGQWIVTTHREILRYNECGELLQKVTLVR